MSSDKVSNLSEQTATLSPMTPRKATPNTPNTDAETPRPAAPGGTQTMVTTDTPDLALSELAIENFVPGKITQDIRTNVQNINSEMILTHKERRPHIHVAIVALIANLHALYIAEGGTGKSMMIRDLVNRIIGSSYFEMAGDESSDPGEIVGPVDILGIRDRGVQERVLHGYLCKADYAFLDEFFNLNGVTRHKTMPILNERIFQQGGQVIPVPLKACFMATNILDIANNQAAVWDRVHLRMPLAFVRDRANKQDLVREAMLRKFAAIAREQGQNIGDDVKTTVTKEQLELATLEAYALPVPEHVEEVFQDIHEELQGEHGIIISTRRMVEGMAAVLANSWYNNHEEVKVSDLDILQHCWWIQDGDIDNVRATVLTATNPGEKEALDKLDDLDKLRKELNDALAADIDPMRKNSVGIDVYRNCERLLEEAADLRAKANESGAGTQRLDELDERTKQLQGELAVKIFGIKDASGLADLASV